MDVKVLESLTALLNHALTTQLVITAVVSVVAAAIGAYAGAFFKKKAERLAVSQDFPIVLAEQIKTTLETERVKSAIASVASASLETLKTDLQKSLASTTFWRERAVKMKDITFEAGIVLNTLLENCQSPSWLAKTSIEDI